MAIRLLQRAQLAAKLEVTPGTPETLLAADANLLARNIAWDPDIEQHERNVLKSDLSQFASISGKRFGRITFEIELRGSGTKDIAPSWGKLVEACKHAETIVAVTSVAYDPSSSEDNTLTIGFLEDGQLYQFSGCVGTYELRAVAGEPGVLAFDFLSSDFTVTDAALLTGITYETT